MTSTDDWYCTDECDHAAGVYQCEEIFWRDVNFDWRECTCGTGCYACEKGAP